ncbi:MAG: IS1096 element passenger TnpR family protein [Bryobacteraceae bacterium]
MGGVQGYYDFLAAIADPAHEEHRSQLAWGGYFKAEEFDLAGVNAALKGHRWRAI